MTDWKKPRLALPAILLVFLMGQAAFLSAYPLDGAGAAGILRLQGYLNIQEGKVSGRKLPPGALLATEEIRLGLLGKGSGWDLMGREKDPALQKAVASIFEGRHPSYAVTVVDITDPKNLAWAGMNEEQTSFPGSVGKLVTMVALFEQLRVAFPDVKDRERVLRETVVVADGWAMGDHHKVPVYDEASSKNRFRPVQMGDRFTLAEWVDHMASASANSAGAMVWKEAILLHHFGKEYPVGKEKADAFFKETPKQELHEISQAVNNVPMERVGINLEQIRQGTLWTKHGQARIPGIKSFASPKELARLLLRMEQGKLVDEWSSLEMKRFLYMTRKRYRYVYPSELHDSAVYFKSGSYYSCKAEEGFRCGKYAGNVRNNMNSTVIVESPAKGGEGQRRYIVALTSNILRKNSAWDHARIGAAIDEAVRTRQRTSVKEKGSDAEIREAGRGE